MKITTLILLSFCSLPLCGQQTQQRSVGSFSGVHASEGIDVYLKKGDKESVKVEVSEGRAEDVLTDVAGTSLKVHMRSGSSRVRGAKVYVTYVKVEKLVGSSGSNIFSDGVINASELIIHAASGANIEVEVDAKSVVAEANSAGELEISGKTGDLEAEAESGGVLNAYELMATDVKADASSGGSMRISVSEKLVANASSAGTIRYRGNPEKSVTNSSSAGSVKKTN